jgi:pyrroline-5-carboxylate reductase
VHPTLPEDALVLSIAAGVTIAELEAASGNRPVVRAMPNTGALVGKGAAAIAAGTRAGEQHLELAERVLGAVGTVVRVPGVPPRRRHRTLRVWACLRVPPRGGE